MESAKRFVGWLSVGITLAGAIAMVVMMMQIVLDGFVRKLFSSMIPATNEIAAFYCMVSVTFLPLAYIHMVRGHVVIELFTGWMSPRATYFLDGLIGLLLAAGAGWFAYAAGTKAVAMTRMGEFVIGSIIVTTWPSRWILTVGIGSLAMAALIEAIDDLITGLGYRTIEEAQIVRAKQTAWLDGMLGTVTEKH